MLSKDFAPEQMEEGNCVVHLQNHFAGEPRSYQNGQ